MDDYEQAVHRATEHHQSLRLSEAVDAYRQALAFRSGVAGVHNNLGSALRLLGRGEEAVQAFLEALRLDPIAVQIWSNLGNLYKEAGQIDRAIMAYRQAISLDPDNAEAHNNLAATLEDTGDMAAAIACYRRAAELKPDSAAIGSNLVYAMHFSSENNAAGLLAAHRAWNDRFARHFRSLSLRERLGEGLEIVDSSGKGAPLAPHPNPLPKGERTKRRLRIGYVSPDFRDHVVGRFMRTILANHDRSAVEVFCYSDVTSPDDTTRELRSHAEHWRMLLGMSDEQAAARIREDGIDILVDLTMHMARNRLLMFARRPAPVQVTYLAYCSTTGLEAMDYRVTDPYLDPWEGSQPAIRPHLTFPEGRGTGGLPYTERSLYLPESYWCYGPPNDVPDVSQTPGIGNGFVTFGCLNNFCKVSPEALVTWAEILLAVPRSRLILHAKEGAHRQRVLDTLSAAGVTSDRVTFVPMLPLRDYFALYGQIDIALDPFPYSGGTTTFDALWMGATVVTLHGQTAVGRGGVSILSNLGLKQLIAESTDEYVKIAIREGEVVRLNARRLTMRERLRTSIVTDGSRWTRQLEAIFQQIAAGNVKILAVNPS